MSQITDHRLKDAELSDTIDIHVALGADGEDRTLRALRELQERRQRDAIAKNILSRLKDILAVAQSTKLPRFIPFIDSSLIAIQKAEEAGL